MANQVSVCADSVHPHAVASITGTVNSIVNPEFEYDNNGNMKTGAGRTIEWTSFNMPSSIINTSKSKKAEFLYNPEHERTKELQTDSSVVVTLSPRYDTGLHFEKKYMATGGVLNGSVEYEHYLYAGGLMFGKYITVNNAAGTLTSSKVEYYHKDHLGSIVAITNQAGVIDTDASGQPKRYSYDVWGKRRYPNGAADPKGLLNNSDMYHGYTGHEMLDDLGLIHMNGRLYDPMLGRFVSADFMIPDAGDLQSYNRYAYVFNNPLAYTDASGQCPFCLYAIVTALTLRAANVIDTQTARTIIGLAVGAWMGPGAFKAILGPMGSAVAVGGITGGISSGWDGARAGMLSAGLFYVAGSVADVGEWGNGSFGRTMTHAVAGCIGASASGGNCSQGAMAAGFAQFAGPIISDNWSMAAKTFGHAMLGGMGSVLGGGKFENGAVTGAFGYLFNSLAHPINTHEAGVRQAILRGDVAELGVLLGSGTLSAQDALIAHRALTAMQSVGAENSSLLASRYGVDWVNKVGHIFEGAHQGQVGQALLRQFGSPAEAMAQMQRALEVAKPSTGLFGNTFNTSINVQGLAVQVRGRIVDGIYRIGTIEKW